MCGFSARGRLADKETKAGTGHPSDIATSRFGRQEPTPASEVAFFFFSRGWELPGSNLRTEETDPKSGDCCVDNLIVSRRRPPKKKDAAPSSELL